jgi:hypothetical protein
MNKLLANVILLTLALLAFFGLYEVFPKPGWVNSGVYTGYAINQDLYKTYGFDSGNYQGSRIKAWLHSSHSDIFKSIRRHQWQVFIRLNLVSVIFQYIIPLLSDWFYAIGRIADSTLGRCRP